jgi:hypothetical protein
VPPVPVPALDGIAPGCSPGPEPAGGPVCGSVILASLEN